MEPTLDQNILEGWIGRSEHRTDLIRAEPVRFMEMLLDREPILSGGDALPPLWHWLFFLNSARQSELGRDGHPALGGFLPPVALPRRMWAGGRFEFVEPIRIGENVEKKSKIASVKRKSGRSGELCFVTVRHELIAEGHTAFIEEHDIVYRQDSKADDKPPQALPAPPTSDVRELVDANETMLFRYSALTFNGHRIHYDRDYAKSVEGYNGLIVHGPLIATLLVDLAVRQSPTRKLSSFRFRALTPITSETPFHICANVGSYETELWAERSDGAKAMQAHATFSG